MQSGFDKTYAEKWLGALGIEKSFYECLNKVEN